MTVRLSLMMFLQFAILGAWIPVFGPYLQELKLTPGDIAAIFATSALASIVAPLPWSQIADRWLSAERCISLCAAVAGVLLWCCAELRDPVGLLLANLGFWMFMMPVMSLAPSLAFRHVKQPERQYGIIRMWGTIGWMAAGWALTLWFRVIEHLTNAPRPGLSDALRWGAVLAWTLAGYALTLPATPPSRSTSEREGLLGMLHRCVDAPLAATTLFRVPAFLVYVVCCFGAYVSWPFNMQMTAVLVESRGVPRDWLPMVMSISQSTEVLTLAALPFLLRRLGQRRTQIVGIGAWALALAVLTVGQPTPLLIASLLLHGFYITCFLVAGQVFINRIAQHHYRASAQGLLVLVNGFGMLLGNVMVGAIRARVGEDDFYHAFLPAMLGVAALAGFFALGFWPRSEPAQLIAAPVDEAIAQ